MTKVHRQVNTGARIDCFCLKVGGLCECKTPMRKAGHRRLVYCRKIVNNSLKSLLLVTDAVKHWPRVQYAVAILGFTLGGSGVAIIAAGGHGPILPQ